MKFLLNEVFRIADNGATETAVYSGPFQVTNEQIDYCFTARHESTPDIKARHAYTFTLLTLCSYGFDQAKERICAEDAVRLEQKGNGRIASLKVTEKSADDMELFYHQLRSDGGAATVELTRSLLMDMQKFEARHKNTLAYMWLEKPELADAQPVPVIWIKTEDKVLAEAANSIKSHAVSAVEKEGLYYIVAEGVTAVKQVNELVGKTHDDLRRMGKEIEPNGVKSPGH